MYESAPKAAPVSVSGARKKPVPASHRELVPTLQGDEGFGLYVHWPFCLSKCPYCDFNSHVAGGIDHGRWRAALIADMRAQAVRVAPGRRLTSIFFGGGTPSLMDPATTAAIIEEARRLWPPEEAGGVPLEITLEANPGTVDQARFRDFRQAGVNRLSIGIQALDDADLRFLGRRHDAAGALAALDTARSLFDRVSFDLIYARPGQSVASWDGELTEVLRLGPEHLSVYQLTIEPGTRFFTEYARGGFAVPDEDLAADLFIHTRERLADAGLPAYEISNHARPGAACRHNLVYWRGGDYVGVGPGAHGRLWDCAALQESGERGGYVATAGKRAPDSWLQAVERDGEGMKESLPLDLRQRAEEMLMMGLRLGEGVNDARLRRLTGLGLADLVEAPCLEMARDEGLVTGCLNSGIAATESGTLMLNTLTAALMTCRPCY